MGLDFEKFKKRSFKDALSRASDDFSNKLQDKATNALSGALGKGLRSLGLSSSIVSDITSRFADSVKADLAAEWYGRSRPETNRISGEGIRNNRTPEAAAQVNEDFKVAMAAPGESASNTSKFPLAGNGKYFCSLSFREYQRPTPLAAGYGKYEHAVFLPLPRNLVEMYGIELNKPSLGTIGAAFDEFTRTGQLSNVYDDVRIAAVDQATRAIGPLLNSVVDNAGTAILTAIQQTNKFAFNPHLSVMFQGVQLRPHTFRWLLAPDNEEDSKNLLNIIYKLRAYSLPNFLTGSTAMFSYPKMVTVDFFPWASDPGTRNNFYPIKQCLIEGVSINYAPNGIPSFFKGGYPTMVELEVRLFEMEYFTQYDFTNQLDPRTPEGVMKDFFAGIKKATGVEGEGGQEPTSTNTQQEKPQPGPTDDLGNSASKPVPRF